MLAYADDVNLRGDIIRTTETNADLLLNACKEFFLGVNIGKAKYMEVKCHQSIMENDCITVDNSYERTTTFKYLVSLLTNQISVHEEITCRLKARHSSSYSVQTLLFS